MARVTRAPFSVPEDHETVALLLLPLVFLLIERLRPSRPQAWRDDLRRDVLAFVVLAVSVAASRAALRAAFAASGLPTAAALIAGWPSPLRVAFGLALADLSLYWIHRAMHTRWLWRTHAWHHASRHLYWFSGFRTSCAHALLFAAPQVAIPFLFGFTVHEVGAALALGVGIQLWAHANLDVDLGPLRWVIVSPQYHRAHHALEATRDKNFAIYLPLWDLLFGTWQDPATLPAGYALGATPEPSLPRMLVGV